MARAIDRVYPGPGGKKTVKLAKVFQDWADFEDNYVSPSACVLPDGELKYVPTSNSMRVIDGTWEPEGQPGLGLYLLAEARREFDIYVRADTAELRNALKAGIEAAFVEDRITLAPLNGMTNSIEIDMPEYWGLSCALVQLTSRKLDDETLSARRVRAFRTHLWAVAPHVKLGIVQPFRPRTRVFEELPDGTLVPADAHGR